MTAWPYLDIEQSVDYYKAYTNQDEFILNKWYFSHTIFNKTSKVYSDELICLKECNDLTTLWLCGKKINPVVLRIHAPLGCRFKQNKRGEDFYEMTASIKSVDDFSFTAHWLYDDNTCKTFNKLLIVRDKIKEFVDSKPIICGEDFVLCCLTWGAKYISYR